MRNNKKNVIKKINKRFQTTIIGAIARFEDSFGYLWGQNTEESDLTDTQKDFLDLWESTRTSILNHGNRQMRESIDEVMDYIEEQDSYYKYHFIIKNKEDRS